ncbi:hypothetical protein ACQV24_19350 [Cronobacter sakazakii]|uniref:hypothetical protein n=1 Tax=Cronobacter sakazakii TaxID=28141 RepID=UPI003D168DE5
MTENPTTTAFNELQTRPLATILARNDWQNPAITSVNRLPVAYPQLKLPTTVQGFICRWSP